jgi:hypothetical protein
LKLDRLILAILAVLVLLGSLCPAVQADDDEAKVDLKVEVVPALSATTRYAYPITASFALLHGKLNSLGTASSVLVYFEWGATMDYGHQTKSQTLKRPRPFSAVITHLIPDTTYHFRAVAVSEDGTSYGSDVSFKTRKRWWWSWWKWRWW